MSRLGSWGVLSKAGVKVSIARDTNIVLGYLKTIYDGHCVVVRGGAFPGSQPQGVAENILSL